MCVEIVMDSGSSISLIMENYVKSSYQNQAAPNGLKLVSAAEEPISVVGKVVAPIQVGVHHNFVVVHSLITPVILGMDFLQKHGIMLDFTTTPVTIHNVEPQGDMPLELESVLETARTTAKKVCAVASIAESSEDIIDSCAVPLFEAQSMYDMP